MRKYEIMFIVKPDLEEASIKKVAEDMKSVLETNNAKVLESVDGAKIIEQKDLNEESLNNAISYIISDDNLEKMSFNVKKVIVKNVEENIYKCIKDSLKK